MIDAARNGKRTFVPTGRCAVCRSFRYELTEEGDGRGVCTVCGNGSHPRRLVGALEESREALLRLSMVLDELVGHLPHSKVSPAFRPVRMLRRSVRAQVEQLEAFLECELVVAKPRRRSGCGTMRCSTNCTIDSVLDGMVDGMTDDQADEFDAADDFMEW